MRSGSRLRAIVPFALILALMYSGSALSAERKNKSEAAFSVIAGTIFREPGFALPGVEVTLTADPAGEAGSGPKFRKMSFLSNTRGEFAFRVPSAKARYVVKVAAPGLRKQEKTVEVQAEDRVDVTFMLAPESKE